MKSKAFLLAAVLLTSISLSAQEKEIKEDIGYSNITEAGLFAAGPWGMNIEATTIHGFSLNKQHHFGLGFGIGNCIMFDMPFGKGGIYMPVFANYRYYFYPKKSFSPHVNASLGGLIMENGSGMYSALAMGIKSGHFSLSSGFSFTMMVQPDGWGEYEAYFTWGLVLKCGFTF